MPFTLMLLFVQAYYRFADTMDPDVWFEPSEVMCILYLNNILLFHIKTLISLKTLCMLADLNPYDSAYYQSLNCLVAVTCT